MAEDTGTQTRGSPNGTTAGTRTAEEFEGIRRYAGPVIVTIVAASIIGFWTDWWTRRDMVSDLNYRVQSVEIAFRDFKDAGPRYTMDHWNRWEANDWKPFLIDYRELKRQVILHERESERYKQMIEEMYKRNLTKSRQ